MFHAEEKILQKFKEPIAIEEDKKDDSIGLTATMEFEFRQAFELVSGGEESIPKDKIIEILRAVGFSFQSWDIDWYKTPQLHQLHF